jgi:[amino group carrier protein]-L-2-aminoadipate 6-kinase
MIVIKIGGGEKINLDTIVSDLKNVKEPFIIVHGANFMMDMLLKKFQIAKKYYTSSTGQISRATDQKVIDTMYMAYCGYTNKTIVAKCQEYGINAIGLSGIDGSLLTGKRHEAFVALENGKKKVIRDDLTGTVETVNTDLLAALLEKGFIPVITPPILSFEKRVMNTDGDKIAAKIAVAMNAEKLLFLIEAPGFLQDVDDPDMIIPEIQADTIENYLESAKGRMKKKLFMSKWALKNGVKEILIADGRIEKPVTKALTKGGGTIIR